MPDNTVVYLFYQTDVKSVVDSTKVRQGAFSFTGTVKEPVNASVGTYTDDKPCSAIVYLENGIIQINADKEMSAATVKAGPINKVWNEWKQLNGTDLEKTDSTTVAAFIKKYPASPVSLDILLGNYRKNVKWFPMFSLLGTEMQELDRAKAYQKNVQQTLALKPGQMAPDFTVQDPDGKTWKLSDYRGKYVYVDFWASWCKPCRAAHPWLKSVYDKFKNKGFVLVGISLDYKKETWMKALKEDHVDWQQGSELKGFNGEIPKLYQITVLPNGVLVDPDGRIVEKGALDKTLEARLGN